MSAAGCQTGMPVLCQAHNGTPEHTTGTGFVPGRITSEAPDMRDMHSDALYILKEYHELLTVSMQFNTDHQTQRLNENEHKWINKR